MTCKSCGKEIPDGSKFCNHCGKDQNAKKRTKRANGEGSVYKYRNGFAAEKTRYINGKRITRRKRGFKTRKEALEWLAAAPKRKAATLAEHYESWSTSYLPTLAKSKQCAYSKAFERIESIAYTPIDELTINDLQTAVDGLSYYNAKYIKTLLKALMDRACAQNEINNNLAHYIKLPKLEETERQAYTEEEVIKLWEAFDAGNIVAAYALIMIYTGMMTGELLGCKKSMIDLDGQKIVGASMKTDYRRQRDIMLPDIIIPVIEATLAASPQKSDNLVAMNTDKFYASYHRMQQQIGIRDLTPYCCRHTTASVLAKNESIAPTLITRVMRQKLPITTERYKHADDQQILETLNAIKNPMKHSNI